MSRSTLAVVVRHLRAKLACQEQSKESDEQLLHAFLASRDDSAFAVLVRRYGSMVLHVCRRALGHEQDAEDAFQATFLVLAQNAARLRNKTALASFLHGTAYRIAMKAKQSAARRRKHEGRAPARPSVNPTDELSWREVRALVDEEVARLPEKYRSAFILCCLENVSQEDAAQRLALKEGTVSSRLTRARKILSQRLAHRGVELTAALAAAALATPPASAVPAGLMASTIKAAMAMAADQGLAGIVSASVAELVKGMTTAMMVRKAKMATVMLLAVSLLTVATSGSLVSWYGRASGPLAATPADPPAAKDKPQPRTIGQEQKENVQVSGRVLDPDGKPVAGAKVVLHQRRMNQVSAAIFPAPTASTTDADGRFHFSGNVYLNAPIRDLSPLLVLTAHVPGYGPAAVETESPDELREHTLRLVKDDVPLRGRVLNLEGRPVAGVTVRPISVVANAANDLGRLIKAAETNSWNDLPNEFLPNIVFSASAAGLTQTTKTDRDGQFTLSGFGRERIVVLRLDGPTIETCLFNAMTRNGPTVRASRRGHGPRAGGALPRSPGKLHPDPDTYVYALGVPFDFAAGPALVVEGTVRDQDTGKPIAGVVVRHGIAYEGSFGYNFSWAREELTTTTDADGHYRLAGLSRTSPGIHFAPPRGQPYFSAGASPPAHQFGKPAKLDIGLKRGVLVKGRVTNKATGQPVQAAVQYFSFADNPHLRTIKSFSGSSAVSSKKDGSFTLAVLRGRGILAVKIDEMRRGTYLDSQGADALEGLRDAKEDFVTRPYICVPWQFNTLVGIDPDAKAESITCDLQLDPGKTVTGTILDPDGKPLAGASTRGPYLTLKSLRDLPSAEFTIPAINPRKPEAYFFEHRKRNLAAAVILKGDEGAGFTVKLKPTATITGRLVTKKGEPVGNYFLDGRLEAGQLNLTRPFRGFFWVRTDAQGRFKTEGLLTGVQFSVSDGRSNLFTNLMLQPGEVRDLGDIKITNIPE